MSKKYSTPSLEIARFDAVNIIVTSPTINNGPSDTDNWNLGRERDDSDWDIEE